MPCQYVREPLTADEAERLANAGDTPTDQLIVRTLLDTGLRVRELLSVAPRHHVIDCTLKSDPQSAWHVQRIDAGETDCQAENETRSLSPRSAQTKK
jgi:integrase